MMVMLTPRWTPHRRAHKSAHMRAHIWERIGAHRGEHTYESTYRWEHMSWEPAQSKRCRNAQGHFTRAILCGNLQENAGPRSRGPRFVRACAVDTHMDISQEPLYAVIYRKNAAPLSRGLRSRNAHGHFTRAILCGNLQEKCRTPRWTPRLNTGP